MQVSVSEAKAQLTELVRRAEAGNEVILTPHGKAAAKLVPIRTRPDADTRRALITAMRTAAGNKQVPGTTAARSQDFLYDDDGLPK